MKDLKDYLSNIKNQNLKARIQESEARKAGRTTTGRRERKGRDFYFLPEMAKNKAQMLPLLCTKQ